MSQLSQLIGINQVTTENNGLSVTTTSGQLLVSEGQSFQLTTGTVNGATDFFVGGTDITSQLASGGGQLGGYSDGADQDIPNALNSLDQLAYSISTAVNAKNNAGRDLNGATGTAANPLYIFNEPTQVAGSAATMSVMMTDPNQIAAASAGQWNRRQLECGGDGDAGEPDHRKWADTDQFLLELCIHARLNGLEVQTENTAQNASVTQLQTQNNALSSVNLNDEAAAMSTLETSYQAASQVFTLLNTIMASALNLGEQTTVS